MNFLMPFIIDAEINFGSTQGIGRENYSSLDHMINLSLNSQDI